MALIEQNVLIPTTQFNTIIQSLDFPLPEGFIDFMKAHNGGIIDTEDRYIVIWPLQDMHELNELNSAQDFAPGFFLIGTDGGLEAYAIETSSGFIFQKPWISSPDEDAEYISDDFSKFLEL